MSRAQAFGRHKMFSEGRNLVEYGQRSGQASTTQTEENTARVTEFVRSDRRLRVRMIADKVNIKPGNSSFDTDRRTWDEKKFCQDGAQESQTATAG